MQDIVNGILIEGGSVLLCRRSTARKSHPNSWSFPGGHVEIGESLDDASVRELQEEVGVTPLVSKKIAVLSESSPQINGDVVYHFFVVSQWSGGEPRLLGNEHSELRWFGIEVACALPDLALSEYAALLQNLI